MKIKDLQEQLEQINSVKVTVTKNSNQILIINQLIEYNLEVDCEKVFDAKFISSPVGENCLQMFYLDGGGIIVTPNDFVFNVEQDGIVQVNDLPPMCSIRELISGFESYRRNPNPSGNMDYNYGLFYLHYYIFKSAIAKGFKISMINELYSIGAEYGFLPDDLI
jgi:hypothetical protein